MKTFFATFAGVLLAIIAAFAVASHHEEKVRSAIRWEAIADERMALVDRAAALCSSGTTDNSIAIYKHSINQLRKLADESGMPAEKRAEILRFADSSIAELRQMVGSHWIDELKTLDP